MHFYVPTSSQLLTTRAEGEAIRRQLESQVRQEHPRFLEIDFAGVKALTISFTDEFLGRFLTEMLASSGEPAPIMLSGLNEDTAEEIQAVLERRKLVAASCVTGRLKLLGGDKYLRSIFEAVITEGDATPGVLAKNLGVTVQNANNRLKRLVESGALERTRLNVPGGGREFSYRVPEALHTTTA